MELLTDLLPVFYGLAAGVLGALLMGQLQRRLAYQRGYRHGYQTGRPLGFTEGYGTAHFGQGTQFWEVMEDGQVVPISRP